ncbi:hypothetical protein VSR69_15355 [Paraburkholderia phytofirmans]|jgi:predicted NAD/FAD-dependent oxidoreductase|uniref:hypothetical protein n=1 Tax=Paraburkholderia sp. BL9I2N2 TaxID=1938809 RepID=UPI001048E6B4|nr:hypothetical protein [Paraburkholderia sp. BL9I2N2]
MNTFCKNTRKDGLPKISSVPLRVGEKSSPTVPVFTFVKESVLASGDGYTVSTWVALSVPCSGIIMRSQIKIAARTSGNVSEYALSRQAQALSLEQADRARAEKRRVNDARIDSNASKWRYSAPSAER